MTVQTAQRPEEYLFLQVTGGITATATHPQPAGPGFTPEQVEGCTKLEVWAADGVSVYDFKRWLLFKGERIVASTIFLRSTDPAMVTDRQSGYLRQATPDELRRMLQLAAMYGMPRDRLPRESEEDWIERHVREATTAEKVTP